MGWTTQICGMPGRQGAPHNRCVPPTTLTPLAVERVTRDVDCLSRAGLCVDEFFAEVLDSLGRVLPTEGACVATADPATGLVTTLPVNAVSPTDTIRFTPPVHSSSDTYKSKK